MTTGEKYGFVIAQAAPDSDAVRYYVHDHLAFYGYPLDVQPASSVWLGICRERQVWCVIGLKPVSERCIEVPDFYLHRSRWGVLAGYAALEYLRDYARENKIEVVTATPIWNTKQIKTFKKVFGVTEPTHYVFRYRPEEMD
jgi:hypothetical protein